MDIKFRVAGQKLMMLTKYNKFVSDAKDFMCLLFELPAEWSGYSVTAEFVQGGKVISKSLNQKRSVYLPNELSEGVCLLALRGSKTGSVVTTDSVALYIDKYVGSDGSGDTYITVELSAPTIEVNEGGLITASVNQKEGYVVASSKKASLQLPVHSGGVVKPEKNNKVAVPSGIYTTGDLIISGDKNLDPANIRKGATIFDVQGTYEGSVGMELPEIKNPASSEHVAKGREFINELGVPSVGSLTEHTNSLGLLGDPSSEIEPDDNDNIIITSIMDEPYDFIARSGIKFQSKIPLNQFGDADPSQVAEGVYFTSSEGFCIPGEMKPESSSGGVQLPELNNAATDSEVFLNKEYINADGQKRTGNFSIDSELTEQDSLIYQITEALKNKASGGDSGDSVTINATIDGLTATSYTIPSGRHSGYGTVSLTSDIENALAAI